MPTVAEDLRAIAKELVFRRPLIMTQTQLPHTDRPEVSTVVLKRKFSAFLITSAAMFCLTLLFWSMSVTGFVSQSRVRLKLTDQAELSSPELKRQISTLWHQQLSDDQLDFQISDVATLIELKHPVLLGRNFERVRQSLACDIFEYEDGHFIDVCPTYEGDGSEAEMEFVNRIAEQMAIQFAGAPALSGSQTANLFAERVRLETAQAENYKRVSWLVNQIDQDLNNVRRVTEEITTLDMHSFAQLPPMRGDSTELPSSKSNQLDNVTKQNSQAALLQQKLRGLLEKKTELLDYPDSVELVEQLQSQIGEVRSQLVELNDDWPTDTRRREDDPVNGANSSFMTVSHPKRRTSALDSVSDALNSIDVISLRSTLMQMKDAFEHQNQLTLDMMTNDPGAGNDVFPVIVQSVKPAKARPMGGLPGAGTILSLLMLSGLIGSVVAWGYSPLLEDQGFRNRQEIENQLGLPVVSQLVRNSGKSEEEIPICNLVLQLARILLLAITLIVICGLLFSPTIRESFVDNPFNGFCRMIWNLIGK